VKTRSDNHHCPISVYILTTSKFIASINDTSDHMTPVKNFSPVSLTPVINIHS
jgi:hypothetical protein